ELADERELRVVEAAAVVGPRLLEGPEDRGELGRARVEQADHDLAAIRGMLVAPDEAGLLQAIEDAGDRAGGEPGLLGEQPRGHGLRRRRPLRDVEALVIGDAEPEPVGDRLVEEHGAGAELAADLLGERRGVDRCRSVVFILHMILSLHKMLREYRQY